MRKIVNGKPYDIDTAQKIAEIAYGAGESGVTETLYRKRTGEFFLYGIGGRESSYRIHLKKQGAFIGGDKVTPLTEDQAQEWLACYHPDLLGQVFKPAKEAEMRVVTYSIPAHLHERLKKEAVRRGIAASQLLAELIEKGT